jgi:2-polyprenyl-6-methoxyphenol hydroxylase-like FAD-dependent oxidoreductase
LALTLRKHGIQCTIYEGRPETFPSSGAIMLSPNALRVLDHLGVYESIRQQGFNFESFTFKNAADEIVSHFHVGHHELYGYQALRVRRHIVLRELRIAAQGIPIYFNKQLSHIISESDSGVVFKFSDDSIESASVLVGADGIHSKVRRYLSPSIEPVYTGQLAITSRIQRFKIRFPNGGDYALPTAIYGKDGAFLLIPEDFEATEVVFGTQIQFPEKDRVGWHTLSSQKEKLMELLTNSCTDWPDVILSCLEASGKDGLSIWPYYSVPQHKTWMSESLRVILLGDAAHAIPPTAGQGACMAVEDGFTLGLLWSKLSTQIDWEKALEWWQLTRQTRVAKTLVLTQQMGMLRLPYLERERLARERGTREEYLIRDAGKDLHWLYSEDHEKVVSSWVDSQGVSTMAD